MRKILRDTQNGDLPPAAEEGEEDPDRIYKEELAAGDESDCETGRGGRGRGRGRPRGRGRGRRGRGRQGGTDDVPANVKACVCLVHRFDLSLGRKEPKTNSGRRGPGI